MDLYKDLIKAADIKLDESIFDDLTEKNPTTDDLVDQDDGEPPLNPSLMLAMNAIENPNKAKQYVAKGENFKRNMLMSLKNLVGTASTLFKNIQQMTAAQPAAAGVSESSMGVGGTGVADPSVDPGTGIPVKAPIKKKAKPIPQKRLKMGSPAKSGMLNANTAIPGRSAFAKGIE